MQHFIILLDHVPQLALCPCLGFQELILLVPCLLYFPFLSENVSFFVFYFFDRLVLLILHVGNTLCTYNGSVCDLNLMP